MSLRWVSFYALECCLLWAVGSTDWGKDLQSSWTQWPSRVRLTSFQSEPFLFFNLTDLVEFSLCCVCVCLFVCVFVETAIPFRYITELVCYSIRPERESWSGCPAGIYWCSVARVISGTLILFWAGKNYWRALIVGISVPPALFRIKLDYNIGLGLGFCRAHLRILHFTFWESV